MNLNPKFKSTKWSKGSKESGGAGGAGTCTGGAGAGAGTGILRSTMTRIMHDLEGFNKDPPPGIYIESDENCILNHIVLITGPEDTPYEGGFFLFELQFPSDYPFHPPKIEIRSSDPCGQMRFNPNLYINGKVCLSILGTWPGPKWTPVQTLTTCLLCIRSLLNEMPLENEPGYEKASKKQKLAYNEAVTQLVLKEAVIRQLSGHLPITKLLKNTDLSFDVFVPQMVKLFRERYPKYLEKAEKMGREKLEIRLDAHVHIPTPDRILKDLEQLGVALGVSPDPSLILSASASTSASASASTSTSAPSYSAPLPRLPRLPKKNRKKEGK